jgi:hypothetical protein
MELSVNRAQLLTMFAEAGSSIHDLPRSIEGTPVRMNTPRGIRAQYGNCPAPVTNSIQNQIQGPPPPSSENGDCLVLLETPSTAVSVPPGLDIAPLVEIGLELSGLSPDQAHSFQKMIDWKSAISLPMPRFIRSLERVDINQTPGMLLNTASRRGPTYELVWVRNDLAYALIGYGNSGAAVPFAAAIP